MSTVPSLRFCLTSLFNFQRQEKDLGKMVKSGLDKKVALGIAPMKAPIGWS